MNVILDLISKIDWDLAVVGFIFIYPVYFVVAFKINNGMIQRKLERKMEQERLDSS